MPLNLIYGQIGYLRIQIPWRSLSSKPVNVEISDIWLVVQPKTDSTLWQSVETLETSFAKKEELIREMAKALFEEIIVSIPHIYLCLGTSRFSYFICIRKPQKRKKKMQVLLRV